MKKIIASGALVLLLAACGEDGTIVDRMGRAAANTALNNTFNPDKTAADTAKDTYNSTDNTGGSAFAAEIANNLGVYDALSGTCGDNAATATGTGAATYDTLAGYLSNDQLLINSGVGDCGTTGHPNYLSLEAGQTDKCGGRTPLDDAVDVSYNILALGAQTGITDGVDQDDAVHNIDTFPFLAAPQ